MSDDIKLFQARSRASVGKFDSVWISWFVDKRQGRLFGPDGLLDLEIRDAIPDYDGDRGGYDGTAALMECFTADEIRAFISWLMTHRPYSTTVNPVRFPCPNCVVALGSMTVGGGIRLLTISDDPDFDLPFAVKGYYNLGLECHFDLIQRGRVV